MSVLEFYDHSLEDLTERFVKMNEKGFRAAQIFKWVYGRRETSFDNMTDLAKSFRAKIQPQIVFSLPSLVKRLDSEDGTIKFLFAVEGGKTIESVLIPSKNRLTLCVSSEVGCNMGCKFCFTGKQRVQRKLEAREIVGQYLMASASLAQSPNPSQNSSPSPNPNQSQNQRITNIVFMGMGEPLDNPKAVFKSIEILHSSWGLNLSRKKITVSTSGLVPMISQVTASGARLAVSLNAVDDETRTRIMPINKKWSIAQLLDACRKHTQEARDRVTLEYVLLKGVNDSLADAEKLFVLTKGIPCKINIIPFNEHPDSGFERPSERRVSQFQQCLMDRGAHVLRRKTMGRDIFAACGQLTSAYDKPPRQLSQLSRLPEEVCYENS